MTNPIPVTREGLERLKAELEELTTVRRPAITAAVAEARSHGDLRENSAYDAARHDQMMNERRIAELEAHLRNVEVVDADALPKDNVVRLGSTVIVDFDGEEETYMVVGAIEAKPAAGRISNESPMGKQLVGKTPGDTVSFITPNGRENSVTIVRVEN
ncbi:MAG: transcription elongation factor GreA [Thermomicrobiales bacterium]|nr:transcription elongation factor GreA [Thermomicrobiales bacterium]